MGEEGALTPRCDGKVLVVDDDPALLETMECNLADRGYQVCTAADGRAAVELARHERPDALVLDVMLPGLDGFEVCRILRREMSVPILMLTSRSGEGDEIVGLEVGADDCVTRLPVVRRTGILPDGDGLEERIESDRRRGLQLHSHVIRIRRGIRDVALIALRLGSDHQVFQGAAQTDP